MRDNNMTSYEMHLNLIARIKKWNGMDRVSSGDFIEVAELVLRELLIEGYSSLIDGAATVWYLFVSDYNLEDMDFFPRAYTLDCESKNRMIWPMEAYIWVELAAMIAYGKDPELYIREMKQYFGREMEPRRVRRNAMDENLERLDVWVRSERIKNAGAGRGSSAGRMQEAYAQERRKVDEMLRGAEQKAQQILHDAETKAEQNARKILHDAETEAENLRRETETLPVRARGLMERARFEAARITDHARKAGRERLDTEQRSLAYGEQKKMADALLETEKTLAGVHETLRSVEKQLSESFIQRVSIQLMELYDLAMDSYESISEREELPAGESLLDLAEVVAQDLAEYGIEPIITEPGAPYSGAIHEAVGKEQFDPRSVIVRRSLRFGFRRGTVILRKEKVEVTDPEASRQTEGEPAFLKESTETAQRTETTQNSEAAKRTAAMQNSEAAQNAEATQNAETVQNTEAAQRTEITQNAETGQNTEAAQNAETTQNSEDAQRTATTQNSEAAQRTATTQNNVAAQNAETVLETGAAEDGQMSQSAEPQESMGTREDGEAQESAENGDTADVPDDAGDQ